MRLGLGYFLLVLFAQPAIGLPLARLTCAEEPEKVYCRFTFGEEGKRFGKLYDDVNSEEDKISVELANKCQTEIGGWKFLPAPSGDDVEPLLSVSVNSSRATHNLQIEFRHKDVTFEGRQWSPSQFVLTQPGEAGLSNVLGKTRLPSTIVTQFGKFLHTKGGAVRETISSLEAYGAPSESSAVKASLKPDTLP